MIKSKEFKELDAKLKRKFSKLKMEVDVHDIAISELDELVEEKTSNVIKKKLIKQVVEAVQSDLEAIEKRILNNVANKYYDYIKDQASMIIAGEFKKGIKFKHRIIYSDVLHDYEPIKMMNEGWRIVYVGPLQFENNNRKNVFIFEKPVKNKVHARVTIKKQGKKVIRNPK